MHDILNWSYAILSTSPARWFSLVEAVPLDLLSTRPAPSEWSVVECLKHVVDVEKISTPVRLKALLAETPFPGFQPDEQAPSDISALALAEQFATLRQQNLTLLKEITAADLERRALHAEYGMVSLSEFLHHIAAHDLMHIVQAEQALMQPLIQACGSWVVNYDAHIAR